MKQHETRLEKVLNDTTFYVRAFPGMTAMYMSGELLSIITPAVAGLVPLAVGSDNGSNALDMDLSTFTNALAALNGDKVVHLTKILLLKHKNISVETEDGVKLLDEELANEVFCGSAQDMYVLMYEVIRVNFPAIFGKLDSLFGNLDLSAVTEKLAPKSTEI